MKGILKKVLLGFLILVHMGLCAYEVFTLYFMSHLRLGTYINGVNVGGMKAGDAEAVLEEKSMDYILTLQERDHEEEKILGSDIGYYYEIKDEVREIKEGQYPYWWIQGLWNLEDHEVEIKGQYDEGLLEENIDKLTCLTAERSVKPENAGIELVNGKYEIIEGDPGSLVKKETLVEGIKEAVEKQEESFSLEEGACYEVAEITAEDAALKAKRDTLNKYVSSVITYDFGKQHEVIDGDLINTWIDINDQNEVILNEEAVQEYINTLADTYDTVGKTRSFVTSVGSTVTVSGGDYGWKINRQEEGKSLIALLKTGNQKVTRVPIYEQQAWVQRHSENEKNKDIGTSYVEVNLTRQYLWFYKEGKLVVEGSIVSGTGSNSHATPVGTYKLDYKQANAILRGPGYACPVSYWMPFNGGIGIHDATWRGAFGGSIYVYNGSHGCINASLSMAKAIFEQIEKGMPVVCYKEAI